jgi:hypothetical protein
VRSLCIKYRWLQEYSQLLDEHHTRREIGLWYPAGLTHGQADSDYGTPRAKTPSLLGLRYPWNRSWREAGADTHDRHRYFHGLGLVTLPRLPRLGLWNPRGEWSARAPSIEFNITAAKRVSAFGTPNGRRIPPGCVHPLRVHHRNARLGLRYPLCHSRLKRPDNSSRSSPGQPPDLRLAVFSTIRPSLDRDRLICVLGLWYPQACEPESSTASLRTLEPRFSDPGTPDSELSPGLWVPHPNNRTNISSNSLGYQSPTCSPAL